MWGNENPAVMPDHEIARIRGKEDEDGFVRLPEAPVDDGFIVNEKLRVKSGPFEDHYGIYQGMNDKGRERVLLDWLGGKRTVLFDADDLEAIK